MAILVGVIVTMLSRDDFEIAAAARTPHFIRLVWLLASLINSCCEMRPKPVILCAA